MLTSHKTDSVLQFGAYDALKNFNVGAEIRAISRQSRTAVAGATGPALQITGATLVTQNLTVQSDAVISMSFSLAWFFSSVLFFSCFPFGFMTSCAKRML